MKIWIVTSDLGDGDVGLSYFESREDAELFMEQDDYTYHESNPHVIDVNDDFQFDKPHEEEE